MIVQRNSSIKRSQVWLVTPDPTVGAELQKTRPCVVVSHDLIATLPVRVVVPITEWQERFAGKVWLVRLIPDWRNGLTKDSAANAIQVRCVSEDRFVKQLGVLSTDDMSDISAALTIVLDISL